jgi:hypothetical protein
VSENPYAPPTARVEDIEAPVDSNAPRKRPVLVWIFCLWIWLGLVTTPFGLYITFTSDMPELASVRAFYSGLSPTYWIWMAAGFVLSAVFSVQLFRLRRSAFAFGVAMFALTVLNSVFMPMPPAAAGSGMSWFGVVIGLGFYALAVAFLWRLRRKGVLR